RRHRPRDPAADGLPALEAAVGVLHVAGILGELVGPVAPVTPLAGVLPPLLVDDELALQLLACEPHVLPFARPTRPGDGTRGWPHAVRRGPDLPGRGQ